MTGKRSPVDGIALVMSGRPCLPCAWAEYDRPSTRPSVAGVPVLTATRRETRRYMKSSLVHLYATGAVFVTHRAVTTAIAIGATGRGGKGSRGVCSRPERGLN